ncbi:MAG: transcription termination/antitermination factor NusG [Opitutales bacterium]|nr:transcription termination/antitermination factor NusG [Opitutales bacterium]
MTQENTAKQGRWYVVQTLSNLENKVKNFIEKQLAFQEMEDYIFEVLMPTEVVTEVKNGKKSQKTRKLYPGYVFLHMRLYDEDGKLLQKPWYYVNGVDGVIGFVGGQSPHALKDDEIARILDNAKEAVGKEVPKVQYEVGENVRITDGPFLNLNGTIDEIDQLAGKLKVSVSIFGRFTPVTLEFWQVERVVE